MIWASGDSMVESKFNQTSTASSWPFFLLILALAVTFAAVKCLQHYSFYTNDYDTGIYSNLAWNIAHSHGAYSSILGRSHLGEHFSPIMVVFAPFFYFGAGATYLMLIAQALAVCPDLSDGISDL